MITCLFIYLKGRINLSESQGKHGVGTCAFVSHGVNSCICFSSTCTAGLSQAPESRATGIAIMQIGLSYLWTFSLQNICKNVHGPPPPLHVGVSFYMSMGMTSSVSEGLENQHRFRKTSLRSYCVTFPNSLRELRNPNSSSAAFVSQHAR